MKEYQKIRNNGDQGAFDGVKPRRIFQWIDYYKKNKPQTNALAAGIMLMIFGGQHLGWGIFNNHLKSQPWAGGYEDEGTVFWAIISWFIASIVGFFVAACVVNKCSKVSIYVSEVRIVKSKFNLKIVLGFLVSSSWDKCFNVRLETRKHLLRFSCKNSCWSVSWSCLSHSVDSCIRSFCSKTSWYDCLFSSFCCYCWCFHNIFKPFTSS